MSEVQKRVEALRQAKKADEDAAENKRKDELIQWEAEMILALEEYTDAYIMEDIHGLDIYSPEYIYNFMPKIKGCYKIQGYPLKGQIINKGNKNERIVYPTKEMINNNINNIKSILTSENHYEQTFKTKYLFNHINNIKNSPEYIEYTKILAEGQRINKEKEEEEKRIANEKKQQEKQEAERIAKIKKEEDDRNKILKNIDDTNNNIRNILRGRGSILDTFTEVTVDNLDKSPKEFLSDSKVHGWAHYSVDMSSKSCSPCITGMPDYFSSYYEDDKVPFLTKCPICDSLTNFNYLNCYVGVNGNCNTFQKVNKFTSVYCNKHYVYYSVTNTHYIISEREGKEIIIVNPDTPDCRYVCWKPNGKWKEWNPQDPDGSKATAEKKRKQAEEIQKQIAELQAKLTALQ